MATNRILLINADYPGSHYDYVSLPVGLGYLSETLTNNNIEHEIFGLGVGGGYRELKKCIVSYRPDYIGYSLMSFQYKHNYSVFDMIKSDFPTIPIVVGGPHISTFKQQALLDCHAIDIGVMMEGEGILLDICRKRPLDTISGVIYRKENGEIVQNESSDLVNELDTIPFPRYEKFDLSAYPRIIPILTSRGCPFQCIFCPIGLVMGKRFRARTPSYIVDEIEYWYRKGLRDFSIVDDAFNLKEERVYALCDEIDRRKLSGLRIRCSNGIRADRVDGALLQRMKEVGFYCIAFGVESASNKVLTRLKKGETIEKIKASVQEACRLGFWVELFFLIGSPGETMRDVEESIQFALRYPIYDAKFYNLIPFPDTELYAWIEKESNFLISTDVYLNEIMHHVNKPLFVTPELSLEERKSAFRYAKRAIDRHTRARKLRFEKWLTRNKLHDYYGIDGSMATCIAFFYQNRWLSKIITMATSLFSKIIKKSAGKGN